jgi:hypothetical protein
MKLLPYSQKVILAIIVNLFPVIVFSQTNDNSYDNWINYKMVKELPANPSMMFVIASTRNFDTTNYSIISRGVNPERKLFYFVVSRIGDSCYIKPFHDLSSAMENLPKSRDLLVFVNGHGKNFPRNLGRGFLLDERYNLNVILFEWPTYYRSLTPTGINARKVTPMFITFIKELDRIKKNDFAKSHTSVIFHSMGNHIAKNMAKSKDNNTLNYKIFDNLILNAAAVTHFGHKRWVEKLKLTDRVYINSNAGDFPLSGVYFLRKTKPLGMAPKPPHARNAIYIDFTKVAGEAHNYYTGKSELEKNNVHAFEYYNTIFHGGKTDTSDSTIFKEKENGLGFFIR